MLFSSWGGTTAKSPPRRNTKVGLQHSLTGYNMHDPFHNLIRLLSTLPGIGQRSALRIVFYLLKQDTRAVEELSMAMLELKQKLRFCKQCGGITQQEVCEICCDTQRNPDYLCIVEQPKDIFIIEKTGEFSGYYHVLMGALSPLDGIGPEELRINELVARLNQQKRIKELFLATNPTIEGDATADYIHKLFAKNTDLQITRISHGIPTGSAIEFAEPSVLAHSIRTRTALSSVEV